MVGISAIMPPGFQPFGLFRTAGRLKGSALEGMAGNDDRHPFQPHLPNSTAVLTTPPSRRVYAVGAKPRLSPRTLAIGIACVIVLFAAPLYGFLAKYVTPLRTEVVRVNDITFDLGDLLSILRLQGNTARDMTGFFRIDDDPFHIAQTLAQNELIKQAAPRFGIVISEADIDYALIRHILGGAAAQDSSKPPDRFDPEFRERYRQFLNTQGIPESLHRRLIEQDLYRTAFMHALEERVADADPETRASLIRQNFNQWITDEQNRQRVRFTFNSDIYALINKNISSEGIAR